jgi:Protein of unknown function (DUF1554)
MPITWDRQGLDPITAPPYHTSVRYLRVTWVVVCAFAACSKVVDLAPDAAPACDDNVKNGNESDVDCGGLCAPCGDAKACSAGPDCASGICSAGTCAIPSCTDGVKNGTEIDVDCAGSCAAGSCKAGQACDDNAQCASQMCAGTNVCIAPKRVFITTGTFTGAQIGGLIGADAKCQAEANAAQLGGTYKAWLSDITGSPSTRFTRSLVAPYVRPDGLILAQNYDDLVDGTLGGAINRNAMNQPQSGAPICDVTSVWVVTNTRTDGVISSDTLSCNNWTSNTGGSAWGRVDSTNSSWTSSCSGGTDFCAKPAPLYCFEQ